MMDRWHLDLPLGHASLRLIPLNPQGEDEHLREGRRYVYRLIDSPADVVDIEPRELFEPDPDDGRTGRFTPRECVGSLAIRIEFADHEVHEAIVEVRPTKLSYETQYQAMLDQLAEYAAEALLQGFAPATHTFHPDPKRQGGLRYRSLAFLLARFHQPAFIAAVERIKARPHRGWVTEVDERSVGRGTPAAAGLVRALQRSASGIRRPDHLAHLPFGHLPRRVTVARTESTYDTPPNRFIRFVFARWQALAMDVARSLQQTAETEPGPRRRGRREAAWAIEFCEEVLALPALKEAGELRGFPHGNQVLLRQPGYREILGVFALTEATIALDAVLPDDPFSATQRNVATLYEYWCFVALVKSMSSIAGSTPAGVLFESSANGMSLVLREGRRSRLSWEVVVEGRVLLVDLWFNRTFSRSGPFAGGSWSRSMRPDVSLRIRPRTGRPTGLNDPELDVWLHFDAKYRIETIEVDSPVDGDPPEDPSVAAKREDLLKMHAYRDAIRRSAGAYVLYPGAGRPELRAEYHELLPGLGAFPLRPKSDGGVDGAEELEKFVSLVLAHVANQASATERTQYWTAVANRRSAQRIRPVDFLAAPPADTQALVGYVRGRQLDWVRREKLYNLRADNRRGAVAASDEMLRSPIVVLWTGAPKENPSICGVFERVGPWQVATADELGATGYHVDNPDALYLVSAIEPLGAAVETLVSAEVVRTHQGDPFGSPYAVTWAELTRMDMGS
jgi:predicted component of viral defense system (DUF524 family)